MHQSRSRHKLLTLAVLAALLSMPSYGYAFKNKPEYVYYNGRPIIEMQFLAKGEELKNLVSKAGYTLDPSLISAVKSGAEYWTGMLGEGAKNSQPWQTFVTTERNEQNAGAVTISAIARNGKAEEVADNLVAQQLQEGKRLNRMTEEVAAAAKTPDGEYGFSRILIGQYLGAKRSGTIDGWWVDTDTVLPTNEQAADFTGTIRHELGHALGILLEKEYLDEEGNVFWPKSDKEADDAAGIRFHAKAGDPHSWNMHLADQNLNPAKPGMWVVTTQEFNDLKKEDRSLKKSDFFIVDTDATSPGRKGKAFFIGKNVSDALAGAKFYGVSGLPVSGWEFGSFEGSHLQTAGMMSHRAYSNYTSLMEVELAVMQDLGYNIDRKAYYGYSVYGDGGTLTNTQGYSARDEAGAAYIAGTPSKVPLGVGLHIYGSKNTVTQAADILTEGTGAVGVRVDGMRNTLIVPKNTTISAGGLRGNGILIAYGRDQTVNQAGTVTAKGQGGTGIRFDFGSSTNGASDEYRGSYIRYEREVEEGTGKIEGSTNLPLTGMDLQQYNAAANELNGPQVREYNLSGTLEGGEHAIFISRNALVKNININEGASIKGDIVSDWKHFKTDGSYDGIVGDKWLQPLYIQYKGNAYTYDTYIPDLVTSLNVNTDFAYYYNITGKDNMKLNIKSGTMQYGGTADVVGVTVTKGAALLGGHYKVHDMSDDVALDFLSGLDDSDKGNVINHGTFGAMTKDRSVSITGNLISDGTLQGVAGGSAGKINVSGTADIDGSTVIAKEMLPGEKVVVLNAASVAGNVKNTEDEPYQFGLLDESGAVEGNTAVVTGTAADNLGETDAVQAEACRAMMGMYNGLAATGDARRNEMRPLFTMTPGETKKALSSIASNAAVKSMALAQRSTVTKHILASRLTEAFMKKDAKVKAPMQHLNDCTDGGMEITVPMAEPAENDIWLKFGKNWGDMRGGSDYHSSAILLGWDKTFGKNWRGGLFAGYGKTSFADKTASDELNDVRFGLYAGYSKGRNEGMVYLDHGWLRNKLRRGIAGLGLAAGARYHSRILEMGGEYLYDLHAGKNVPWHVRPYVNAQISCLWQNGYREEGAGVFGQNVRSQQNNYVAAGTGVEFKRCLAGGSYAIRVGVKHAFAGAEPRLRYGYLGDQNNSYEMRNAQDKTHFILAVGGEVEFRKGWYVGGDATLERGAHDKDWSCTVTVKRIW